MKHFFQCIIMRRPGNPLHRSPIYDIRFCPGRSLHNIYVGKLLSLHNVYVR